MPSRRTPRRLPTPGSLVGVSLVALVVVAGVVGLVLALLGVPPFAPRASAGGAADAPSSIPAPAPIGPGVGGCPPAVVGDMSVPEGVRIESVIGHARLVGDARPARTTPFVACWPHSTVGALSAAMSIAGQVTAHPENPRDLLEAVYVQDEAGAAATERAERDLAGPGATFTVLGYSLVVASDRDVLVTLGMRVPGADGVAVAPFTMRWDEGDWRLLAPTGAERSMWMAADLASAGLTPIEGDAP